MRKTEIITNLKNKKMEEVKKQNVDVKSMSKEERNALLAQLQQEEKTTALHAVKLMRPCVRSSCMTLKTRLPNLCLT